MIKKVSFDFDKTLEHEEVQVLAAELIAREDVEVHIVTFRYSDENTTKEHGDMIKERYPNPIIYTYGGRETFNGDIWRVCDKLGIPHDRVHFTNYTDKDEFFEVNPDFWFHLDDDRDQLAAVKTTAVRPILYGPDTDWKEICELALT